MDDFITRLLQIPPWQRWLAIGGLLVLLGLAFNFLVYSGRAEGIARMNQNLARLQGEVSRTKIAARRLPVLEKRLADNNRKLQVVSQWLPDTREIPELLTQVSRMGKRAGLEFLLFQPQKESPEAFYATVPVKLQISGSFAQVMTFFRALSQLPRIVNVTDLKMGGADVHPGRVILKIDCLATTFRFLKDQEVQKAGRKSSRRGPQRPLRSIRRPAQAGAGG